MNIQGKNYKVHFDGKGTLSMSGKLAAMPDEYQKIDDFFESVIDAVSEANTMELVLDLRDLIYLNSSGIKTLCVSLVMEADDAEGLHLKILCNNSLTWQVETLPTFKDLMDNLEIVFE
ncbi:hypothetical protein QUF90_00010 [Desulfococcaceae bacterium HSG9]|nr:hypothetical protein [Desulfococcaceae bacterium HSG9]